MSTTADGLIVCLLGFPGVGKLTVAKALAPKLNAKIVDNHWINDPILRLIADDSSKAAPEAIWSQVAKVREAALETIATLAPRGASFIFTYTGADENPRDHMAIEEYRSIADRRSMQFIAVRLVCGEEELARRIQSAGRVGRKLIDPVDAITNVRNYTVLDPRLPDTLTLDTTDLLPEAVATFVPAHIDAGHQPSLVHLRLPRLYGGPVRVTRVENSQRRTWKLNPWKLNMTSHSIVRGGHRGAECKIAT